MLTRGQLLTRAPMEYSRTLPADGGGGRFSPRAICQTTGPILDPKMAFDSTGLELSEYPAKFCLKVADDVTGVKEQFFAFCHCWLRRAKQTYQIEIKSMERHELCLRYFLVPS